jgi:hypothetical protein
MGRNRIEGEGESVDRGKHYKAFTKYALQECTPSNRDGIIRPLLSFGIAKKTVFPKALWNRLCKALYDNEGYAGHACEKDDYCFLIWHNVYRTRISYTLTYPVLERSNCSTHRYSSVLATVADPLTA